MKQFWQRRFVVAVGAAIWNCEAVQEEMVEQIRLVVEVGGVDWY